MLRGLLTALLLFAWAQQGNAQALELKDRAIWENNGFLSYHPDVKHRKLGLHELEQGNTEAATSQFRQAARFADKPSQAMLAEMYWEGEDLSQDRALAYAWMDLAAERGYTLFVAKRERYWTALGVEERQRALHLGQALYRDNADSVAWPRLARVLERMQWHMTGSRVGMVGPMQIHLFNNSGYTRVDGSDFYRKTFTDPQRYFEWTDTIWQPMPRGNVRVGDPQDSNQGEADGRI